MFILPTLKRPHNLKRFIDAYVATKAKAVILCALDDDDPTLPEYHQIVRPPSIKFLISKKMCTCDHANRIASEFPDAPYYGFLADDLIPRTDHWDQELTEAAGFDGVSYPNDKIWYEKLTTHPVIGGDIVRELGWVAAPGLQHFYADNIWMLIGQTVGKLVYLDHVVLEHMHFLNGKAPDDSTYRKDNSFDRDVYNRLIQDPAFKSQMDRIRDFAKR